MPTLLFLLAMPPGPADKLWPKLMDSLERSGRAVEIVQRAKEKLEPPLLAPGAPPLLSFRYLEGQRRQRFGELGLVLDDAGH